MRSATKDRPIIGAPQTREAGPDYPAGQELSDADGRASCESLSVSVRHARSDSRARIGGCGMLAR